MTISLWRYSHLALAVSCFLFLTLAAATGIILSVDAVQNKNAAVQSRNLDQITLAQAIPVLQHQYMEITELKVKGRNVTIKAIDNDGNDINASINPASGKVLGPPARRTPFIESVTSLHRSLFLHETGRIFMGINAFILFLIALSGILLLIQRQQGLMRFLSKIVKDYFAQYYHVVFGRLMLIPILILSLTGTFMCLHRFHVFNEKGAVRIVSKTSGNISGTAPGDPSKFRLFQTIPFSAVKSIAFPFSEDPEEHYTLTLQDKELTVDQFTGNILTETDFPATEKWLRWSVMLHTGRTNPVWAAILGIAAINILIFIYTGFAITFRRRSSSIKNRYSAGEATVVLLVGSENGTTLRFANAIYNQLLANNITAYITELNHYQVFPKAAHIIVMTATYGTGNAPADAQKFEHLLAQHPQLHPVKVSVVGFGSKSYPDFCAFAYKAEELLRAQKWAEIWLPIHTVADKSSREFCVWVKEWGEKAQVPLVASPALYEAKPKGLKPFIVVKQTFSKDKDLFTLQLRPAAGARFTSGDLLTIYPAGDSRERFYSIGKKGKDIHLVVRAYPDGLGSTFLQKAAPGTLIKGRMVQNAGFHFPRNGKQIIMIANGTGIAPFLGMIAQNKKGANSHLYYGFREKAVFEDLLGKELDQYLKEGKLKSVSLAFSREAAKQYVTNLLQQHPERIYECLAGGGTIMICGSLSMQNDVLALIDAVCREKAGKGVEDYRHQGQIKTDCY